MAKFCKPEPVITHTAILALAGKSVQREIIRLKNEVIDLRAKLTTDSLRKEFAQVESGINQQIEYHRKRLAAIDAMYIFETGTPLGLLEELNEEETENV